jgi:hypothetical protein
MKARDRAMLEPHEQMKTGKEKFIWPSREFSVDKKITLIFIAWQIPPFTIEEEAHLLPFVSH